METYVLIDILLSGELDKKPWCEKGLTCSWVQPLYESDAAEVSPILIDIDNAVSTKNLSVMMELVNAKRPQLGVSLIESELDFQDLLRHLRKFIFIRTISGEELTFRFADCAVLPAFSSIATTDQWGALVQPIHSWKIHGRDGKLTALPIPEKGNVSSTPLVLLDTQRAMLNDAMGTDRLLFNLRQMRSAEGPRYETAIAYELAYQARCIWRDAGKEDCVDLLLFARQVFSTQGKLLRVPALSQVLAQSDLVVVRKDLQRLTSLSNAES